MRKLAVSFALLAALSLLGGCVFRQHRDANDARNEYRDCTAEHADQPEICESLRQKAVTEERRYEEASRQAWGCPQQSDASRGDPTRDDCPGQR